MSPSVGTRERSSPDIDPRLRARRIAVRRDVGRRRLHRLGVLAALAAVLAGAVVVALSPLLDVEVVEVAGTRKVTVAEVRAASGVEAGDQLVLVDRSGVAERVERVPWVATASVARSWPGTIVITVVERTAAAGFVGADGRLALADAEGRILDVVPAEEAGSKPVVISGLESPGAPGEVVAPEAVTPLRVATALPRQVADRVGEVAVEEDGDLTLLLEPAGDEPGPRVLLGDGDRLAQKVSSLATVLARVDLAGVVSIDLEVPSAPALTRR